MSRRTQRVEQLLRRELSLIAMSGELRDPRLAGGIGFTITDVRVSADLSHARVFVDVLGERGDASEVIAALAASAGVVRSVLAGRVQMRRTPQLRFELDETMERAERIDRILDEIRDETRHEPPDADSDQGLDTSDKPRDHDGA